MIHWGKIYTNKTGKNIYVYKTKSETVGVQMYSGHSASIFKSVINNIGITPMQAMMNVLNSEYFERISI